MGRVVFKKKLGLQNLFFKEVPKNFFGEKSNYKKKLAFKKIEGSNIFLGVEVHFLLHFNFFSSLGDPTNFFVGQVDFFKIGGGGGGVVISQI